MLRFCYSLWFVRLFSCICKYLDTARSMCLPSLEQLMFQAVSPHRDEKSSFTSCVISSWEVLISYRASDTSHHPGRLTCKEIFRLDSSNECSTRAITWHMLHMEEENSHLSFCDFHFHFCSLHSLFSVSFFFFFLLEIITSHVRIFTGWRGRNVSHSLLSF